MKIIFILFILFTASGFAQHLEDKPLWKIFFDKNNVTGCMVIFNLNEDNYLIYNRERSEKRFLPASTFKILNSLIALETGVIKDENEIIPWDSVQRTYDMWNMDQTLRSAIRYSAVWAYQVLARKIGEQRMKHFVDTVNYGNNDISGGIDSFWLSGGLRISPAEQVNFLKRLYFNDLPFSQRNIDIVKNILINDSTGDYVLRGKTGWATAGEIGTGWYVGYLEENDNVWFFANNIDIKQDKDADARIKIVREIFSSRGLLK